MISSKFGEQLIREIFTTRPWYIGLSTEAIPSSGTVKEPSKSIGYERIMIPANTSAFSVTTSNVNPIASSTISIDIPFQIFYSTVTVKSIFLSSTPTGNAEIWTNLNTYKTVMATQNLIILKNSLQFRISNET